MNFSAFQFSQKNGSFIANNQRNNIGLYALERYAVGNHQLTFGLRHDYQEYDANSFTSDDGAAVAGEDETSTRFSASKKTFNNTSISFGTSSKLSENLPILACGPTVNGHGLMAKAMFLLRFPIPTASFPVTMLGAARPT